MELDPVFVRALRLLHSTSKESGIQLKAMIDESIRMKKNPGAAPSKMVVGQQVRENNMKDSTDSIEMIQSNPSTTKFDSYYNENTIENLDLNVDLEGLIDLCCIICKTLDQESGNKLIECNTCQNLYHQECHEPVISNEEEADPLFVWNCFNCGNSPNLIMSLPKNSLDSKPSKISSNLQSLKSSRPASGRNDASASGVFKRNESSKSHSSTTASASGGKPAGMAALAATYKGSSGSSGSSGLKSSSRSGTIGANFGHSKSSSGNSSSSSSSSNIMSADKRLQLMKKKAAQRKK